MKTKSTFTDVIEHLRSRTDIPAWEYDGLNDDEVESLWSISTDDNGLIRLESSDGAVFTAQLKEGE